MWRGRNWGLALAAGDRARRDRVRRRHGHGRQPVCPAGAADRVPRWRHGERSGSLRDGRRAGRELHGLNAGGDGPPLRAGPARGPLAEHRDRARAGDRHRPRGASGGRATGTTLPGARAPPVRRPRTRLPARPQPRPPLHAVRRADHRGGRRRRRDGAIHRRGRDRHARLCARRRRRAPRARPARAPGPHARPSEESCAARPTGPRGSRRRSGDRHGARARHATRDDQGAGIHAGSRVSRRAPRQRPGSAGSSAVGHRQQPSRPDWETSAARPTFAGSACG